MITRQAALFQLLSDTVLYGTVAALYFSWQWYFPAIACMLILGFEVYRYTRPLYCKHSAAWTFVVRQGRPAVRVCFYCGDACGHAE